MTTTTTALNNYLDQNFWVTTTARVNDRGLTAKQVREIANEISRPVAAVRAILRSRNLTGAR